jgi:biotin carboxyl carrier protein
MRFVARHDGVDTAIEVERYGGGYRVTLGDRTILADLGMAGPYIRSLRLENGTQYALMHHRDGNRHQITLSGATYHVEIFDPLSLMRRRAEDEVGGHGVIKALMPGRIVRVLVAKGDSVAKGAGLLVLEAMKMENEIQSPADGVVDELFVEAGQTVEGGAELVHITAGGG